MAVRPLYDFDDPFGLKKSGVIPATGPVGVPNQGGIAVQQPRTPRPVTNPVVSAEPGRPTSQPTPRLSGGGGVGGGVVINVGTMAPAPAAQSTQPQPQQPQQAPAPSAAPSAAPPAVSPISAAPVSLPRVPSEGELELLPPGDYETPAGRLTAAPGGARRVVLNPAGQAAYQTHVARRLRAFGARPLANDPNAPAPPIVPGKPAYNPFDDFWSG